MVVSNDKSEKKSKKSLLILLVIVAIAILVFATKKGCPIPIPVPADQTSPTIESKAEEPKKIELDPKVEVPVIGDPSAAH